MKKPINIIIYSLLTVALLCACFLGWYYYSLNHEDNDFKQLSESVHESNLDNLDEDNITEDDTSKSNAPILAEDKKICKAIELMSESNSHLVGWVTINRTSIDYPVMYAPLKPEYYLHRNFEGAYSVSGTPFADTRCWPKSELDNIIIYGHNMKNGSMFAALPLYAEESFYEDHKYIKYYTSETAQKFKVFAVIETEVHNEDEFDYYFLVNAEDEAEFKSYIEEVKSHSIYEIDIAPEYGDSLITLSTCSYNTENGRFIVFGVAK